MSEDWTPTTEEEEGHILYFLFISTSSDHLSFLEPVTRRVKRVHSGRFPRDTHRGIMSNGCAHLMIPLSRFTIVHDLGQVRPEKASAAASLPWGFWRCPDFDLFVSSHRAELDEELPTDCSPYDACCFTRFSAFAVLSRDSCTCGTCHSPDKL